MRKKNCFWAIWQLLSKRQCLLNLSVYTSVYLSYVHLSIHFICNCMSISIYLKSSHTRLSIFMITNLKPIFQLLFQYFFLTIWVSIYSSFVKFLCTFFYNYYELWYVLSKYSSSTFYFVSNFTSLFLFVLTSAFLSIALSLFLNDVKNVRLS